MNSTPSFEHSCIFLLGPSFTEVTSIINVPSFMNGANFSITPSVLEIGTEIITISLFWTIFLLSLEYFIPRSLLTCFPTMSSLPVTVTSYSKSFKYHAMVLPKPRVPPIIPIFMFLPMVLIN